MSRCRLPKLLLPLHNRHAGRHCSSGVRRDWRTGHLDRFLEEVEEEVKGLEASDRQSGGLEDSGIAPTLLHFMRGTNSQFVGVVSATGVVYYLAQSLGLKPWLEPSVRCIVEVGK